MKSSQLGNLNLVWMPDDHTAGVGAGDPNPVAEVADNDLAVGRITDTVSCSKFCTSSAVVFVRGVGHRLARGCPSCRTSKATDSSLGPGSASKEPGPCRPVADYPEPTVNLPGAVVPLAVVTVTEAVSPGVTCHSPPVPCGEGTVKVIASSVQLSMVSVAPS